MHPGGKQSEQLQGDGERGPAKDSSQESTVATVSAATSCGDTRRFEREVGAMLLTVFTARERSFHLLWKAKKIQGKEWV